MTHYLLLKPSAFPKLAILLPKLLPSTYILKAMFKDKQGNLRIILLDPTESSRNPKT